MKTPSLSRRAILVAVAASAMACKREERCRQCGMKIDPNSPWRADLVAKDGSPIHFDTPRCALLAWRSGKVDARELRVQEYYERNWRTADDVRFMIGGDVIGPMGPDLVPVDPSRVTKFIQDHGASRALRLGEITTETLHDLK